MMEKLLFGFWIFLSGFGLGLALMWFHKERQLKIVNGALHGIQIVLTEMHKRNQRLLLENREDG